jgi:hypothetical protein
MRTVTSARLRAVGFLLVEAAGLAILLWDRVGKDAPVRAAVLGFVRRLRAI